MQQSQIRSILVPLGIGLILGAFSLAPSATNQYFTAKTKARETSIQAEFLVRDWRGSIAAGDFYLEQLNEAINAVASGTTGPKEFEFSRGMREVIEESALASEVPPAKIEESFRLTVGSMVSRLQIAKSGNEFAKIAEQLRQDCPVDSAQVWELARDAEKAKAMAIAAAEDLVVARTIFFLNIAVLTVTVFSGCLMLWSSLTGRCLPKEHQQPIMRSKWKANATARSFYPPLHFVTRRRRRSDESV